MARAFDQVALVQVIGPHADAHQLLHQVALDVDTVVDARQQHRLVAKLNACPAKAVCGCFQFGGDFIGMVDVDIQPQRVIPP